VSLHRDSLSFIVASALLYRRPSTFLSRHRRLPALTLFPYTTLFRSRGREIHAGQRPGGPSREPFRRDPPHHPSAGSRRNGDVDRSEEHTSELQSSFDLVCRLLLEKKTYTMQRSAAATTPTSHITTAD